MKNVIIIFTIGLAFQGMAQAPIEQAEKMQALQFMEGSWEGGGWIMDSQTRTRSNFTQKEEIKYDLNGVALVIRGTGYAEDGKQIHNALGVVSYDVIKGSYEMYALLETGNKTIAELKVLEPGKLEWGFEVPGGTVRYLITVKDGVWTEKGDFSPDKVNWYPFIEFSLNKK
jgi:hypothetical protein